MVTSFISCNKEVINTDSPANTAAAITKKPLPIIWPDTTQKKTSAAVITRKPLPILWPDTTKVK